MPGKPFRGNVLAPGADLFSVFGHGGILTRKPQLER
jgi:hypothetical protein